MKRNLVGKIFGKTKIFVQDFVPIRTALRSWSFIEQGECAKYSMNVNMRLDYTGENDHQYRGRLHLRYY